jgi:hypothetical protein
MVQGVGFTVYGYEFRVKGLGWESRRRATAAETSAHIWEETFAEPFISNTLNSRLKTVNPGLSIETSRPWVLCPWILHLPSYILNPSL